MRPTARYIPGRGWISTMNDTKHTVTNTVNICPDVTPYYSEALDVEIRSRRHRDKLCKQRGLRPVENGESRTHLRPPSNHVLSEDTKKLHGYIKSHGVNWNVVAKHMPGYLPKGA